MENRAIEYQTKWGSEFGDEYQARNSIKKDDRLNIWFTLLNNLGLYKVKSALEIGCSRGHNLYQVHKITGAECMGIEINEKAIKERYINNIVKGSAYELPFIDNQFELVFTAGVLIHLSDTKKAMEEIKRVSSKYILSIEYYDKAKREIDYRHDVYCSAREWDVLWKELGCEVLLQGEMKNLGVTGANDDFSKSCHYFLVKK